MPDDESPMYEYDSPPKTGGRMQVVLLATAAVYVLVSLLLLFNMRERVNKLEAGQVTMNQSMESSAAHTKATTDALAKKLGMTENELQARTAEMERQHKASISQLAKQQKEQIEGVKTEVGSVKTEVGGVKSDVATAQSDLQATKARLENTIGDLGVQSGVVARNHADLEMLKRRGERSYYEFTLLKNKRPVRVSTISLQLKKADPKRSKYTLNVIADDHSIEKKDRTLFEPLQFYTGRDRQLYELVIMAVDKDKVSGYLSTPKELVAQAQPN
jgi:hypothetical protein